MNQNLGPDPGDDRPEIKIVDRRSFTSDGRRREDGDSTTGTPQAPPREPAPGGRGEGPAAPPPSSAARPEPPVRGEGFTMNSSSETERSRAGRDAAFVHLCVSLYESGCIHLGLRGESAENAPGAPDFDAARGAIEMLEMLKRKTGGHLSLEEQQILDSLLAELQMAYVMKAPGA